MTKRDPVPKRRYSSGMYLFNVEWRQKPVTFLERTGTKVWIGRSLPSGRFGMRLSSKQKNRSIGFPLLPKREPEQYEHSCHKYRRHQPVALPRPRIVTRNSIAQPEMPHK